MSNRYTVFNEMKTKNTMNRIHKTMKNNPGVNRSYNREEDEAERAEQAKNVNVTMAKAVFRQLLNEAIQNTTAPWDTKSDSHVDEQKEIKAEPEVKSITESKPETKEEIKQVVKEEPVIEIKEEPNVEIKEESAEEPVVEEASISDVEVDDETSVEATSTAIPRVEDNHVSGDRPVDFGGLIDKKKNKGKIPDLIKAAKTLAKAEKDLPPEQRSVQSSVLNYVENGAIKPQDMIDPNINPQFNTVSNPNPYFDAASGLANVQPQQQNQQEQMKKIPIDFGAFSVDNPTQQKPKVEKAKAENVEGVQQITNIVEEATESLGVESNKKVKYTVLQQQKNAGSNNNKQPVVDNTTIQSNANNDMIKKYWWLEGIEKCAINNGCVVKFVENVDNEGKNLDGIVYVNTFINNGSGLVFTPYKSFIIDCGKRFYDGRVKAFLTTDPNEIIPRMLNGFEIFDNSDRNTKKWKEDFLNAVFKGGVMGIDPASGMYSEKLRQLNIFVDLSSTPTKRMNNKDNDRANARDRLIKSMSEIFVYARERDPICRFKYYDFDPNSKVFLIMNDASPTPISILYTPEGATVSFDPIEQSIINFENAKSKYKKVANKGKKNND